MDLIDINSYPVNVVLKLLLCDKTTKKKIIFANNVYTKDESLIDEKTQITVELLKRFGTEMIQPRVCKSIEKQVERTRNKAEVFTPAWVCNKMNNHCDAEWFGEDGLFNKEIDQGWEVNLKKIPFVKAKDWQRYIDSKRLEITCGEAPYIVSRYDASTGERIDIDKRIGILDRKLRVVNENTETEKEYLHLKQWLRKWSIC